MLQAWIDNELGDAERVILQQHVAECRPCFELQLSYQRTAALLFETFRDCRLRRSLRTPVLENLPEMNPLLFTVRARNRASLAGRYWLARHVPALAVALVLSLGGLVYVAWQNASKPEQVPLGVVTGVMGNIRMNDTGNQISGDAAVKARIVSGQYLETLPNSRAILALRGPTHVKINENTMLRVTGDRELQIEKGRVWFDVAKATRKFTVDTPAGTVTVHGTMFDVAVTPERTVVTVTAGKVEISNGLKSAFVIADEQGVLVQGKREISARKVDAAQVTAWTDAIQPDAEAYQLFARDVEMQPPEELPAEQVFVINTVSNSRPRNITSFFLTWENDLALDAYCSYEIHIYNDSMQELFKSRIDGSVFENTQNSIEIKVPGNPISGVSVIHVRLIPDFSTGERRISFTKVSALGF